MSADPALTDATATDASTDATMTGVAPAPGPASVPRHMAAASLTAMVIAAIIAALGVVAVRDGVIAAGWLAQTPWLPPVLGAVDVGVGSRWLAAAVLVGAVGFALVVAALMPARHAAVPVAAESSVYLDLSGVARVASAAAATVPGVVGVRSSASRRTVSVRCTVAADREADVEDSVKAAVAAALAPLATCPRIAVRLEGRGR